MYICTIVQFKLNRTGVREIRQRHQDNGIGKRNFSVGSPVTPPSGCDETAKVGTATTDLAASNVTQSSSTVLTKCSVLQYCCCSFPFSLCIFFYFVCFTDLSIYYVTLVQLKNVRAKGHMSPPSAVESYSLNSIIQISG